MNWQCFWHIWHLDLPGSTLPQWLPGSARGSESRWRADGSPPWTYGAAGFLSEDDTRPCLHGTFTYPGSTVYDLMIHKMGMTWLSQTGALKLCPSLPRSSFAFSCTVSSRFWLIKTGSKRVKTIDSGSDRSRDYTNESGYDNAKMPLAMVGHDFLLHCTRTSPDPAVGRKKTHRWRPWLAWSIRSTLLPAT